MKRLALILALMAAPALAQQPQHTQDAVVYDPATGEIVMIVIPANDAVLDDPAFNPPGLVQERVAHVDGADPVAAAQAKRPEAHIELPSVELEARLSSQQLLDGLQTVPAAPDQTPERASGPVVEEPPQ